MDRRGFLKAMFAAGCAPAFIKADSLMKLVVPSQEIYLGEELVVESGYVIETYGNSLVSSTVVARTALQILKNNLAFARELNRGFTDFDSPSPSAIRVSMPKRYSDFTR